MSRGREIGLRLADHLAGQVLDRLGPLCVRVAVAGSVRRRRTHVHDIEVVLEPFTQSDLLGTTTPVITEVHHELRKMGTWTRGGPRFVTITDLLGVEGVGLDVAIIHPPAQWGSILAIRTGPPALSKWCVWKMREFGYIHVDGHVRNMTTQEPEPTPTEEQFFECAGMELPPPDERDSLAERLGATL